MKRLILVLLFALILPSMVVAADDPSIPAETKKKIQTAMEDHVKAVTAKNGGSYPIFDSNVSSIIQLNFLHLHSGVAKKGKQAKYYVSCADFNDNEGNEYDVDFFVSKNFEVMEALVHKKNGKKLAYDVR